VENFFQLHFMGRLFDQPVPEYYSAHREMDNLGRELAAAKRLSTLPAVIRQPLALNNNILSRETNSSFPCAGAIFRSYRPNAPTCGATSQQLATRNK